MIRRDFLVDVAVAACAAGGVSFAVPRQPTWDIHADDLIVFDSVASQGAFTELSDAIFAHLWDEWAKMDFRHEGEILHGTSRIRNQRGILG